MCPNLHSKTSRQVRILIEGSQVVRFLVTSPAVSGCLGRLVISQSGLEPRTLSVAI